MRTTMLDRMYAAFSVAVENAVENEDKRYLLTSDQLNRIGLIAALEAMRDQPSQAMLNALRYEAGVNGYHTRGGPLCIRAIMNAVLKEPAQ